MKGLTGQYEHNIDTKGRLIIPSRMREALGDACYITLYFAKCLAVYSEDSWDLLCEKMTDMEQEQLNIMRYICANSVRCEFDAQGRVLIPQKLRNFVGIMKNVTIIGFSNHAEIWDKDEYDKSEADTLNLENIAKAWKGIGI